MLVVRVHMGLHYEIKGKVIKGIVQLSKVIQGIIEMILSIKTSGRQEKAVNELRVY